MKKELKNIFLALLVLLLAAALLVFAIFLKKRRALQASRILIISDKYFDELVLSKLDDEIDDFCTSIGCKKEKYIIDVRDNPISNFQSCFTEIEKKDSTMILLSPFATILMADNSSFSLANLHYRPIIVGLGNRANYEAFDFIFDMNTSFIYKDLDKFLDKIGHSENCLYIYDSINHRHYDAYINTSSIALEKIRRIVDMKDTPIDAAEEAMKKSSFVITTGFSEINIFLHYANSKRPFMLPYYADYLTRNYYCVLPDIKNALHLAFDNFIPAQSCHNLEMSYIVKYIK